MRWSGSLLAVSLVLALTRGGRTLRETSEIDSGAKDELNQLFRTLASEIDSAGAGLVDLKVQTSDLLKDFGSFKLGAALEETRCRQLFEWSEGLSSNFAELQNLVLNETNSWTRFSDNAFREMVRGLEGAETGIKEGLGEFSKVLATAPRPLAPETLPQPSALVADPSSDCSEALARGERTGVTTITPGGGDKQRVWCDQDTEGGGWTVLMRRQKQDPQQDFARSRHDYEKGFGDPAGEYWLGLDAQVALTANSTHELLVTMAIGAEKAVSRYGSFRVGPGHDYILWVSLFDAPRSTGGDSLTYHNRKPFTTGDRDLDGASGGNCADWSGGGGWWYDYCYFANPTGIYGGGRDPSDYSDRFLEWRKWQGYNVYLTDFAMMVRRTTSP